MLKKGDYVRMKVAPNTRLGTIEGSRKEGKYVTYIFRSDPQYYDPLPDFYVIEAEVELCKRPGDEYFRQINETIKRSSG